MEFFNPEPQRVFTAGMLDKDALEKAFNLWEENESYTILQDRLGAILERGVFCGDDFWPEAVEVNKDHSGRGWDVDYELHYTGSLELTASIDLDVLEKEINAPWITRLKEYIAEQTKQEGYDEPDFTFSWNGRENYWNDNRLDHFLGLCGDELDELRNYMQQLQGQLLDELEDYDTETFNTENFIRLGGLNYWVFDEYGNHVDLDEDDMPQELIDLLDKESQG
jgi:hypothetical protein